MFRAGRVDGRDRSHLYRRMRALGISVRLRAGAHNAVFFDAAT